MQTSVSIQPRTDRPKKLLASTDHLRVMRVDFLSVQVTPAPPKNGYGSLRSAGFSTSGSSDDGYSAKDCKRTSEESSEQSSEAGCVGTDQLSADGSPPSEVPAAKMPAAKVTRKPFGTPMPCAVQIPAAA